MLGNSVVLMRSRPRAIQQAMITMRKSTHGFPFLSHNAYGALLGGRFAIIMSRIERHPQFPSLFNKKKDTILQKRLEKEHSNRI